MTKRFVCNKDYPVAATEEGKLRGFLDGNIFKFYGIKYADAKRWQMPTRVESWEGIKDALGYGYVCPMLKQDVPGSGELRVPHRYWPLDENCQYLNVWTPSLDTTSKKAVMVWLHGGGYSAGSSIEQQAYDGTNMAEIGDIVVVTINHRLNILGYMDLSAFGEKYANSANVGHADIVAALDWVHRNIAQLGGDPENVTIFGQSGGGMKVMDMMMTPAAAGLFQKGIMMSGVSTRATANVSGKEMVEAMMKECGVSTADELAEVPYAALADAYNKLAPEFQAAGKFASGSGPIVNDWYLGNPCEVKWTEHGKKIPLMIGSVLDEFKGFAPSRPDRNTMSDETAHAMVAEEYGEHADEMIALFHEAYPGKNLCELMAIDTMFRPAAMEVIKTRIKENCAPTYSYMFAPTFTVDGGAGAWHCSDIPFAFHNAQSTPYCNIDGVTEDLEARYFNAYVNFAKTGNPNSDNLPEWPACKQDDEAVMVFGAECEVRHNYDYKLIEACNKYGKPFVFGATKIEH